MHIVFDLDNTLTDDQGATLRPGMRDLLRRLRQDGHALSLWTHSTGNRARAILDDLDIGGFFSRVIAREDCEKDGFIAGKDIRTIQGDYLIDDDPAEIAFVRSLGKRGFLIEPYRRPGEGDPLLIQEIYQNIG